MPTEMTDRDHLAAAALTGLLANGDYSMKATPRLAWRMADAMLRKRERLHGDAPEYTGGISAANESKRTDADPPAAEVQRLQAVIDAEPPTLTDEERKAISRIYDLLNECSRELQAARRIEESTPYVQLATTLQAMWERLK